jgi:hypothetical protein
MVRLLRVPQPVSVTAASGVRAMPGVTLGRPPAVAVIGLRRSGRTGNGEGPLRAHRARLPPGSLSSHLIPVHGSVPRTTRAARRTARSARP